ncbi:M23 family metallopeptidase [Pelobacter seleniigenes]|uniref:M23 family metallopeptidase n=1 Tax=Pelobacter seleniigenes TaxID=407188 RepID=UPI000690C92E|nr:M23 family metallopeptidase [Pelobacter seleniigenes]
MAKRFSVILLSEDGTQLKHLHVRKGLFSCGVGFAVVALGLLGFFAYNYFTATIDRAELFRLRAENSEQRQNLQRLVVDLNELHADLDNLATTEARVRQLASLDAEPEGLPVAVGGLPDADQVESVSDIQRQINKLQIEIELRRQSQEDARNLLNDEVSLSRATPEGWPAKGWLTSYFGKRKSPFTGRMAMHEGLDIAANVGTPVFATADGVVARVAYTPGYGKILVIDHGYGYQTIFGHNSKILVKAGQRIKRGEKVSLVGNTGRSTGPHLHYELRLNGIPIDPRQTL